MAPTSSFTVRQKQNAFEEVAPLQASSSASTPKPPCDVFINHCGQDVKHTLATDIYNRLNSQGLNVCLDERWLEAGDEITSELRTAMETASVHIAIFSKNYACSPWCLAELSFMRKTGRKIIPVFYGVEPSDLRWVAEGKGEYVNDIVNHVVKGRYSFQKLVEWNTALHEVSFIKGHVVKSKEDVRALLEDIVKSTREAVRRALPRMYHDNEAVGIAHKITEVVNLLEWDNDKPAVAVVVYGIGGAGKTTLANEVYASLQLQGWKHSKVTLFKYMESHPNIEELQSQILQDLTGIKDTVRDSQIGQHQLKSVIEREDVFIYIDNILSIESLENLLPKQITNPKRVRILATARTTNASAVFESCGIESCKEYAIDSLPYEAALQVLVTKIKKGREIESIVEERPQAIQIAKKCSCCPLFLEVVGGYLLRRKNEVEAYERVIDWLQHGEPFSSNKEYSFDENRIMFAYQQLEPSAQEAFLDICSFFYDWEWDKVGYIVGEEDMKCLEEGALIKRIEEIDHNDQKIIKINIHDLLLQVGRNKSKDNRLTTRDELNVALQNEKLSQIKGIWLVENWMEEFHISSEEVDKMSGSLRVFSMGKWSTTFHVKGKCSKSFDKLWFLEAPKVPNLPFDIQKLTHLTYLDCTGLEDDTILSRVKNLSSLKVLKVSKPSGSSNINGIGELGNFVKLRELVLEGFHQTEISRSLVNLNSLQKLKLNDCSDLNELPESLVKLLSLNLSGCKRLKQLPAGFGKLNALTFLDLSYCCNLEKLPVDFGELSSLQYLNLRGCSELHVLPESLGSLPSLNHLYLDVCKKLTSLPYSLGQLTSLLPSSMSLYECSSLRELPQAISWLATCKRIFLGRCSSLKMIPNGFCNLIYLEDLDMSGCRSLSSLPDGFGKLTNLRELNLSYCDQLKKLCSDFHCLAALGVLNLSGCSSLLQLPDCFGQLGCLKKLNLSICSNLSQLPDCFGQLGCLQKLNLSKCYNLSQLPDCFGQLGCLEELNLSEISSLSQLPDCFGQLGCLKKLNLSKCSNLSQLPDCFGQLGCLEELNLSECFSLSQLPDCFGQLGCLKKLDLSACRSLEKLCHDFHRLPSLITLNLSSCEKFGVQWMDKLGDIPSLLRVHIRGNKMEIHQWVKRKRKENKCNFVADIGDFYHGRTAGGFPLILEAVILKIFDKEGLLIDTQDRPFYTSSLQPYTPLVLIIDSTKSPESYQWEVLGRNLQWLEANSKLAFQIIYVGRCYNALTSVLLLRDRILAYTPHTSGTSSFLEKLFSTFLYNDTRVFRSSGDGLGEEGLKCLSAWEDISYAIINQVTFLTRTPRESNIELLRVAGDWRN